MSAIVSNRRDSSFIRPNAGMGVQAERGRVRVKIYLEPRHVRLRRVSIGASPVAAGTVLSHHSNTFHDDDD